MATNLFSRENDTRNVWLFILSAIAIGLFASQFDSDVQGTNEQVTSDTNPGLDQTTR